MKYRELAQWILTEMSPQEIYQPAAIICLIYHGGEATTEQIHAHLERRRKERNPSVEERSLSETRTQPCKILVNHKVAESLADDVFALVDFDFYTPQHLTAIVALCEGAIAEWNQNHFKG